MYILLTYSTMFINSSSIYYSIINANIHQCIMNNNRHIHTIHSTLVFYVETQCGRKPWNYFLICQRITFKEAQTSNSLAPTIRRLQPPLFSRSNWKVATTTQFYGSNKRRLQPEGSSNSLVLRLQSEGGSNHLSLPHQTALKYKCQM
jgi:hypothetical protein